MMVLVIKLLITFGEDGTKAFDDFCSTLNKVLNTTISVAFAISLLAGAVAWVKYLLTNKQSNN